MATNPQSNTIRLSLTDAEYQRLKALLALKRTSLAAFFSEYARLYLERKENKSLLSVGGTDDTANK